MSDTKIDHCTTCGAHQDGLYPLFRMGFPDESEYLCAACWEAKTGWKPGAGRQESRNTLRDNIYDNFLIKDHLSIARAQDLGIDRDEDYLAVAGYVGDVHRASGSVYDANVRRLLVKAWVAVEQRDWVTALNTADAAWLLLPDALLRG